MRRHASEHLPATLVQAQGVEDIAQAGRVMEELQRCFERVNKLFDACDRWLQDPEDPTRYDIGARAEDISVIYSETDSDGKEHRQKAQLTTLLAKIEDAGYGVVRVESRHADPRELLIRTARQLQAQLAFLSDLEIERRLSKLEEMMAERYQPPGTNGRANGYERTATH